MTAPSPATCLPDDLLVPLLRALTSEACMTEWFASRMPRSSPRPPFLINASRVLRFSLVSHAWCAAARDFLGRTAHRAVDTRGCPFRLIRSDRLQIALVNHTSLPPLSSLTSLSIHTQAGTSDSEVCRALLALGRTARLRSLALPYFEQIAAGTFQEIAHGDACRSTLTQAAIPARAVAARRPT
ncbi:MAG: hypothetical protein SGPRY_006125 [Prymnesium sp.]